MAIIILMDMVTVMAGIKGKRKKISNSKCKVQSAKVKLEKTKRTTKQV